MRNLYFPNDFHISAGNWVDLNWAGDLKKKSLRSRLYAFLTLYSPEVECFHKSLSEATPVLDMGMLRISEHWGKGYIALTRFAFQTPALWSMRSATIPIIRFGFCRLCSGHWNQLGRLRGISNFFPTNHLPSRSFGFSCLMMFLQNQVVGFRLTVMYGTSRKVLSFEGFIYKRLRIMAYSPKLLCKHGLVYKTELLKSNTPLFYLDRLYSNALDAFF